MIFGKKPPGDSVPPEGPPDDEYADVVFGRDKQLDESPDRDHLRELVWSFDGKKIPSYMHDLESEYMHEQAPEKAQHCREWLPKLRLNEAKRKRRWLSMPYHGQLVYAVEQYRRWYNEQRGLPSRSYLEAGEKECSQYVQHLEEDYRSDTIFRSAIAMERAGVKGMPKSGAVYRYVAKRTHEQKAKRKREQSGGQPRARVLSQSQREQPDYQEIPSPPPEPAKDTGKEPQQKQQPAHPDVLKKIADEIAERRNVLSQKKSVRDKLNSEIDKLELDIASLENSYNLLK